MVDMSNVPTELTADVAALAGRAPMPAVGVAVFSASGSLTEGVWGTADLEAGEPATLAHRWDLASLTKVLVTLPEVLALVDGGVLDLDRPIGEQWDRVRDRPVGAATVAQVLSYDAGLPMWSPFYELGVDERASLVEVILGTELERPPGSGAVYSDIGTLVVGEMVSDLTGTPLNVLAGLRSGLVFGPVAAPVVATERCPWRGRLVKGEVHDEIAAALGGVAGNAGAFGTLAEVAAAAARWFAGTVVSPEMHRRALREHSTNADGERFGLGWWLSNTRGLGGRHPGPRGWGMSGFVGNRLWCEPEYGYGVLVLSNRTHPTRGDRRPFNQWCDDLQDVLAAHLR